MWKPDPTPKRRAGDGQAAERFLGQTPTSPSNVQAGYRGRPAERPDDFNGAASWYAMHMADRYELCVLAGFLTPLHVACRHFHELTGGERELIRATVRAHRDELPESSWGLA